jgi:hypothetical protein
MRVEPALLGIILTRPKASPLPLAGLMNNWAGCSRSQQRTLRDPLLLYLVVFERLLRTQRYAPPTIRLKVRLARDFSVWLSKRIALLRTTETGASISAARSTPRT